MPTLLLDRKTVNGLLDMGEVIRAVEQAFRDCAAGKGRMPPKSYVLLEKGDFRAMPAALPGAVGIKWVNVHPQNPARGLPTVMATIIYNDPETGYPLAVMDGTDITAYRTGATAAVASRYLARKGAQVLGVIGAGRQAYTQIEAHAKLFALREIRAFDLSKGAVERLARAFPGRPVRESTLEEAAGSDIVCTLTPARGAFVKREWIAPGAHINAVGADAPGKEELEPSVLKGAVVVVDDLEQSRTSGEINVPVSKGLFSMDEVHGTLDEVISGKKPGRTDDRAITVFDSTGVAIEDVAVAKLIFERAKRRGGYPSMDLIE